MMVIENNVVYFTHFYIRITIPSVVHIKLFFYCFYIFEYYFMCHLNVFYSIFQNYLMGENCSN